jgi:hypothetical protein
MEGHESTVASCVHVGLDVAVSQVDGALERHHGVLQADMRAAESAAAVREGQRKPAVVEVGVVPRRSRPAHALTV